MIHAVFRKWERLILGQSLRELRSLVNHLRLAVLGIVALSGTHAHAEVLQPGVYLVSQDLGTVYASSIWVGNNHQSLDSDAGGSGAHLWYLKGNTTVRAGLGYGLMADLSLSYQWLTANTAQYPYSAGQVRGGLDYVRAGLMKAITSTTGDRSSAFLPNSPIGDLEAFVGFYIPTRSADPFDYFDTYEGVFKMDFGLRHTYYGSLINPETVLGVTYRSTGLPSQFFGQLTLPVHWEACPVESLRYSTLGPMLTGLQSFGGTSSSIGTDFLSQFTTTGVPPIYSLNTSIVALGLRFFHPFSYTFWMEAHYSTPVYAKNFLQYNDLGITLNHLF